MKAYQFADPAKGLELKDPPVPEPGPEQVLIAVEAAGLCHTDLHIIKGHGDAWIKEEPMTLGHEVAGVLAKPGAGVSSIRAGGKRSSRRLCS
jgi:propanol-preferring alcohol dehydrogenase